MGVPADRPNRLRANSRPDFRGLRAEYHGLGSAPAACRPAPWALAVVAGGAAAAWCGAPFGIAPLRRDGAGDLVLCRIGRVFARRILRRLGIEAIALADQILGRLLHLKRIHRRSGARRRHVVDCRKERRILGSRRAAGEQQARRGCERQARDQAGRRRARKRQRRRHKARAHARPSAWRPLHFQSPTAPCRSRPSLAYLLSI